MSGTIDDFQFSDDGATWWDGTSWQPVPKQLLNAELATGSDVEISAAEYPAIAELIDLGDDFDNYLEALGIDPTIFDPTKLFTPEVRLGETTYEPEREKV